jgi:D-alanyl-lipoteichoic acid acyltransferase DltB (MBOAT superfamily)
MLLGGLWHGANWSYVIWGALHGAFLVIHRLFRGWCENRHSITGALASAPGRFASMILTCFCVLIAWCFFQPSLQASVTMLSHMFVPTRGEYFLMAREGLYVTITILTIGHCLVHRGWWQRLWNKLPAPVLGVACGTMFIVALLLAPAESKTFIYFQF